tara:strand:+ start:125 stop:241 length:117 start_codon:yes stop_codon:yes gene_type:complete
MVLSDEERKAKRKKYYASPEYKAEEYYSRPERKGKKKC